MSQPSNPDESNLFAAFVATRPTAICPRCGYSLIGLTRPRCPECGDSLKLEIALVEPRLGLYIFMLASWSIGFGGALLFGVIALNFAPATWWRDTAAKALLALLVVGVGGFFATILARRRIRRLSRRRQAVLAALSALLVLVLSTILVVTFDE